MDVNRAAVQIDAIWAHLSRAERFYGYRPLTVAVTGGMGLVAAMLQPMLVPAPQLAVDQYLNLWIGIAIVSIGMVGIELGWSYFESGSSVERQQIRQAVQQFAPCLIVGGALTWLLVAYHPETSQLLPALWAFCFSLGIFASLPFLAPQIAWVAMYYSVAGVASLIYGHGANAFNPLLMAGTFGLGQFLMAAVLFLSQRRNHDEA